MKVSGVSFSVNRKLSRCEQQYSYDKEEKLRKKIKSVGLFRGDLGHQLVEAHYTKGGPGWEAKYEELVKTRWDTLFGEEREEIYGVDFMTDLQELMKHYADHWGNMDENWSVLHVEKEFDLMTKQGWPVRWKADLVVEEIIKASSTRRIKGHERKKIILVEHKFKKAIPSSEERILEPQVHSYAWLLNKVGIPVESIVWDYIRTESVPRPAILKNGSLSVRKMNTDQRGYIRSLREANLYPQSAEDLAGLENTLKRMPETLSLERVRNSVNLKMGENFVRDWVERGRRAEQIERPLRSWNRNCKFDCDFYLLCQCDMRGDTDRNFVILKNYESKPEREKEELK